MHENIHNITCNIKQFKKHSVIINNIIIMSSNKLLRNFNKSNLSITKKNLTKCCKYSWMSYFHPNIEKYEYVKSKKEIYFLKGDKTASQALYVKEGNATFIAFRGSSDILTFKDALSLYPIKTDVGYIHSGFYNQYLSLKDKILTILEKDDSSEIFFVGHSMGGSVAIISATFLKEFIKNKKIKCYTYGSPCTGDKEFIDNAQSSIDELLSIELKTDIVPYLPMIPFFKKPSNTLILDKDISLNAVNILSEHSCKEYYEKLSRTIKDS